jgi:DNA gyrase subunit B
MQKLIEQGHVYIAQPPLYKIKRGKREEYVQTEGLMSDILLELGSEGMTLTNAARKKTYTDKQLMEILNMLVELERLEKALMRKGINFSSYILKQEAKTRKLPRFRVKIEDEEVFVYNDRELARLTKVNAKKPKSKKEKKETSSEANQTEETFDILEIYEAEEIEEIIEKLEKMGLDIGCYNSEKAQKILQKKAMAEKKEKKASFLIEFEKESKPIYTLKELLEYIIKEAKKGITIQRYKGLGEMNPEQLWETTMDPERRTMLQVKLEDAVAADEMFTILMGDAVEPRRDFIHDHAHEVRNLDI